jgi:hypothetical protein
MMPTYDADPPGVACSGHGLDPGPVSAVAPCGVLAGLGDIFTPLLSRARPAQAAGVLLLVTRRGRSRPFAACASRARMSEAIASVAPVAPMLLAERVPQFGSSFTPRDSV